MNRAALIIDDDPMCRALLVEVMEGLGYECRSARDGEDGWRCFQEEPAPVVLTDLRMPKSDGLELARKVRALAPETLVLLVTGEQGFRPGPEGLAETGLDEVLPKPLNMKRLREILQTGRSGRRRGEATGPTNRAIGGGKHAGH